MATDNVGDESLKSLIEDVIELYDATTVLMHHIMINAYAVSGLLHALSDRDPRIGPEYEAYRETAEANAAMPDALRLMQQHMKARIDSLRAVLRDEPPTE